MTTTLTPPRAAVRLADLAIDPQRLWASLMELARIGATDKGGVCRLALTDLDRQGRELFVRWVEEAGCSVRVDAIGNLFARRPGQNPALPAVATGSHIDTQPTGGKFDGNYGVLAGLEVLRTLNDAGIRTEAPLEVCVWTNEEGSRFVPVMMGSGVYAGAFTLDHALTAADRDGITVDSALRSIGFAGESPASVASGAPAFGAYFEAHIEQGPVLEDADIPLGVVTGALGQRWYDVVVTGQEAHAGPTPMKLRRDALQGATGLMQMVNRIAMDEQPDGRGTVGYVHVHPNSRNVIPGRVTFTVDLRHADDEGLNRMDTRIRQACAALQAQGGLSVTIEQTVYFPPVRFADALVNAVREGAARAGLPHLDIVSGAGHDAVYVARVAPAAMIFVPCKDGISHNEIEDARPEHLAAGCNVLLHAMLDQAGVAA
ncbi:Zn-dependent hydrolase [Variovorax sp. J22G21]|uniref:Zn-dependent hydrolase n=1 Tax=Variovorax fucosicus TaxID=3053517 RepID=UPI0025780179|nr:MULTISPECIES: Zn-dependent hydrolase [unclassified Variovorax]MDM0038454.1 Zn-dependent hydrolase [Variovorax sp. J22R193]MDM0055876.1 Zn-dependent hydrolase [Variovorax sp. J22G47]MDM0063230.1 Zn-dependent hydrolase [Variovorax sp. J22G21]